MPKYTALFFLVMFLIGTDTFLISPLLPTLQNLFQVSTGRAGWMVGSYTLGAAAFALIAGPLSDGWNRRTVLLCGLLGFSASTILCGFAPDFWTMCLLRFLAGVSAAFAAPQVWASIPALFPPARIPKALGVVFAGLAAAQALGVPIGSGLAALHWSVPFWAIGGASLPVAGFAFLAMPDLKPAAGSQAAKRSVLGRYVPLLASGKARGAFLAYLFIHLGSGVSFSFLGKWLSDRFDLSVGSIGYVMIFVGLGNFAGSLVSARISQAIGLRATFAGAFAALVALYLAMPHLPSAAAVAGAYFFIFTVLGTLFPLIVGLLNSLNARIRGTISSLSTATMNAATTLGASISGLLYARSDGYAAIGAVSACFMALSLASFLASGILERKQASAVLERESL
ncbi:MFS transporter [Cohnella zeiphila]|uniref:MFS transporter n=1 Tax=Cohnella zeiphila TaxID=2761120 RepID=A0A7X0VW46_9BACL|nr:MFS transporter [Cohnella zeiphila]MBB6730583.1 MFS transporter [Cohnella zeiphila]